MKGRPNARLTSSVGSARPRLFKLSILLYVIRQPAVMMVERLIVTVSIETIVVMDWAWRGENLFYLLVA